MNARAKPIRAIVFNDTSYDEHHGCQVVMSQIFSLCAEAGIEIARACPIGHDWANDGKLKRDIRSADVCIVNGEGTMHHDAKQAMRYGQLARYCREQNVPCYLVNSVWQDNQRLAEYAADFSGIYVRDGRSQAELAEIGVQSTVVPDLTLSQEPRESQRRQGFIVNGSVLRERMAEAWTVAKAASAQSVRYLSIRTLPPLQFSKGFPGYALRSCWKRLRLLLDILKSRLFDIANPATKKGAGYLRWRYAELSTERFLSVLASSEGVITGRYHCVTLCLLTRTPFLAIASNTHKIEALLDEVDLPSRMVDSYAAGLAARERMAFSGEEIERIDAFLQQSRSRARQMFGAIATNVAQTPRFKERGC